MKDYRYQVVFDTGQIEVVHALGTAEAMILAQAAQIQKGNSYTVVAVERLD